MPGEHDASLDHGKACRSSSARPTTPSTTRACTSSRSTTCPTRAATHRRGAARVARGGPERQPRDARIVVFTHRPLFDLVPAVGLGDARRRAGDRRCSMPIANVTVFYGHIHQEHHHMTGHIAHHAAKSLIFPLPAPGIAAEARRRCPWDAGAALSGAGLPRSGSRGEGAALQDHRDAGGEIMTPWIAGAGVRWRRGRLDARRRNARRAGVSARGAEA